jgi:hypothetical protein
MEKKHSRPGAHATPGRLRTERNCLVGLRLLEAPRFELQPAEEVLSFRDRVGRNRQAVCIPDEQALEPEMDSSTSLMTSQLTLPLLTCPNA